MKKKKTVKAAKKAQPKTKKSKKVKGDGATEGGKVQSLQLSGSIQDKIIEVLNHLLDVAKASLYDGFKQYIEARLANGLPATLEEFITLFTNSFAIHGITDEQLVASLDNRGQEYLKISAKLLEMRRVETSNPIKKAIVAPSVTTQKANTVVQSEQASKIDPNEFSLDTPAKPDLKVVDAKTQQTSVFSDLDVL